MGFRSWCGRGPSWLRQVLGVVQLEVEGALAVPLAVGEDGPQAAAGVARDHPVPAVVVDGGDVEVPRRRAVNAGGIRAAVVHVGGPDDVIDRGRKVQRDRDVDVAGHVAGDCGAEQPVLRVVVAVYLHVRVESHVDHTALRGRREYWHPEGGYPYRRADGVGGEEGRVQVAVLVVVPAHLVEIEDQAL